MVSPSPGADCIGVIVPLAAGEALPPKIFFERVFGGGRPGIQLVAAADAEISSDVREAFAKAGARVHMSSAPRGQRLREAALFTFEESSPSSPSSPSSSSAEISLLLFLHADTLLPIGWEEAVRGAVASGAVGGAFRLSFSGGGARMRWVAFWANLRTRLTRVPYGDQAPFVRRDVYEKLGGHPRWPLLDDWDFARRLRREGRIEILRNAVETSPRRYLERGVARTVWTNWKILWKMKRGGTPEELARLYRR
ncbi:MAG TPA: hypothetical protein VLJ18_01095 [Thermoanaerobaculia bacterium]|nr:hypothetical protein [Thermoanaerobaculia bacterium]